MKHEAARQRPPAAPSTTIALTRNTEPNPFHPARSPSAGLPNPSATSRKTRVGAHREAPALGRSAAHGFNAEARIDQCVAKAGERCADAATRN